MPIKINGATSGSTTIAAPDTGSDETIVLSTALASKANLASPTFTGTPAAPTAAAGTNTTQIATTAFVLANRGKILQVVSATHATEVSTTSTTYVTTNLSASITPSSASNNVLVFVSMPVEQVTQSAFSGAQIALFRGSVSGTEITSGVGYVNGFRNQQVLSLIRMDSPATTSAQTYTIGLRTGSNQVTVLSCHGGSRANLILMEVSA